MASKVNPISFRIATTFKAQSRWFAGKYQFPKNLRDDVLVRNMIRRKFKDAGVARIEIERSLEELTIIIKTSKPGVVIGRGGALIEELKKEIKKKIFGNRKMKINVNIQEVTDIDANAELIYQSIRDQMEQRVPFRRAIKRALEQIKRARALGAKIQVSGRLNGADIARTEKVSFGRLPLHTMRADIDFARGIAQTTYGVIGIKVWVYKGDVFSQEDIQQPKKRPNKNVREKRSKFNTGGQKLILRKKVDVEKNQAPQKPTTKSTD